MKSIQDSASEYNIKIAVNSVHCLSEDGNEMCRLLAKVSVHVVDCFYLFLSVLFTFSSFPLFPHTLDLSNYRLGGQVEMSIQESNSFDVTIDQ